MNGISALSPASNCGSARFARCPLDILVATNETTGLVARIPATEIRILLESADVALRRERAKGVAGHWSYDLNRHIALKRARDRLRAEIERRAGRRNPGTQKAADEAAF